MRIWAVTLAVSLSLCAFDVQAAKTGDVMPPPQKAPRVPVDREALKEPKEFEGKAKAIDGERILVGEKEIRLFGIVTPGISSNYGPQARLRLDQIIKDGAVLCKVTDRDREGRPIAFCGTVDTPDLSYEMLRQGWAMADRKALKNNSLAGVYEKVEQEAQSLNKGLFAPMPLVASVPVSNPSNTVTVPLAPAPNAKAEDSAPAPIPATVPAPVTTATITLGGPQPIITPAGVRAEAARDEKPAPKPAEPAKDSLQSPAISPDASFIERYQGIISGLLWFFGTIGFGSLLLVRDKVRLREKRKALAAALHGELTSARHICRAKARELMRQRRLRDEDAPQPRPALLWPRLRSFVYQSHVGGIGLLGSELARRVASVYGQCAEYAAYYQALQRVTSVTAVSETLSTLADHMDNILEGLAQVEASGKVYVPEPVEEIPVTTTVEVEREVASATDEEAKVIKARFERMAQSMVGMLGRKKDMQYPDGAESAVASGGARPSSEAAE